MTDHINGIAGRIARTQAKFDIETRRLETELAQRRQESDVADTYAELRELSAASSFSGFNRGKATTVGLHIKDSSEQVKYNDLLAALVDLQEVLETDFGKTVLAGIELRKNHLYEVTQKIELELKGRQDLVRKDELQKRLVMLKDRQKKIARIKLSPNYKNLVRAKRQRYSFLENNHPVHVEIRQANEESMKIQRQIEGLYNTPEADITDDTFALIEALELAKRHAEARANQMQEAYEESLKKLDDEISNGQRLVEEEVESLLG